MEETGQSNEVHECMCVHTRVCACVVFVQRLTGQKEKFNSITCYKNSNIVKIKKGEPDDWGGDDWWFKI